MSCNFWNWMLRLAVAMAIVLACAIYARAESYSVDEIVSAIGRAENSSKFPFGIKSIDTKGDYEYARKICRQSVINNYKRWDKKGCFIEFMQKRYAPPEKYWLCKNSICYPIGWTKNVKFWLAKKGE